MSKKKKIDLSDIKKYDLDETASFTDLMTRKERENRKHKIDASDDIDDMINEKRKNTSDLSEELEKAKEEYIEEVLVEQIETKPKVVKKKEKLPKLEDIEENLGKTQIMELTRQMKFNFHEKKVENKEKKKYGISPLNIVGELNLFCMGYYIYLLAFTNYQDIESRYILNGGIIILMVLLFGFSVVTPKKVSKIFHIINIIIILAFLVYNTYTLMY